MTGARLCLEADLILRRRPQDPGGARAPARPVQLLLRSPEPAGHPARPPHRPRGPAPDRVARPGLGGRRARDGRPGRLPLVHRIPSCVPQVRTAAVVADRDPAGHPHRGPDTGGHLDPLAVPRYAGVGAPGRDPRLGRARRPDHAGRRGRHPGPPGLGVGQRAGPGTREATTRTTPRASAPPTWSRTATTASSRATRTIRSWARSRRASTPTPGPARRSWRESAAGSACPRPTCATSRSAGSRWTATQTQLVSARVELPGATKMERFVARGRNPHSDTPVCVASWPAGPDWPAPDKKASREEAGARRSAAAGSPAPPQASQRAREPQPSVVKTRNPMITKDLVLLAVSDPS